MATSTVPPAQPSESLLTSARTLSVSLLWGGWMLLILGFWLKTKHEDLSRVWIVLIWLLALVSFAGGVWQNRTLARRGPTLEEKEALLTRQRHILGLGLVVGGLLLIGLGLFLGVSYKLTAFGEVVGMFLVGLIAIASGRNLLTGRTRMDSHP